jgi:hypothetical protein
MDGARGNPGDGTTLGPDGDQPGLSLGGVGETLDLCGSLDNQHWNQQWCTVCGVQRAFCTREPFRSVASDPVRGNGPYVLSWFLADC